MKHRILYIDDEETNLRVFKNSFRRDFDIITANSAILALEILEQEKIDVVITDQRMPKMTGVELLRKINDKYDTVPPSRLIVSGYAENKDIKMAFKEYKLFKFVSKPWDYLELKSIIIQALNED